MYAIGGGDLTSPPVYSPLLRPTVIFCDAHTHNDPPEASDLFQYHPY